MNLTQANVIELAPLATSRTSSLDGDPVDVRNMEGVGQVILACEAASAGTNPTMTVKLQESATSGGSYTDVPGMTFTQVTDANDLIEMKAMDFSACKGFLKVIGTQGGTSSPAFTYGVHAVAQRKAGRNSSQSYTTSAS